jgi:hypothetical protein
VQSRRENERQKIIRGMILARDFSHCERRFPLIKKPRKQILLQWSRRDYSYDPDRPVQWIKTIAPLRTSHSRFVQKRKVKNFSFLSFTLRAFQSF